jgi:hypothetical protein
VVLYAVWPLLQHGMQPQSPAQVSVITPSGSTDNPAQPVSGRVLEKAGIEILGIGYSAAGYMLDFRYRVLDPEKAKRYITRQIKPVLKDTSSGAKLFAAAPPKLGTMRHTGNNLKKGKTYFVMFANPGRYIQPGSKVDIEIADIVIDGLTVVSGV